MSLRTADGSQFTPDKEEFQKLLDHEDEIVRTATEVLYEHVYGEAPP